MNEIILEKGKVISIHNSYAEVLIENKDNCDECSAKIFCKPKSEKDNLLFANDLIGVKINDIVEVEIKGNSIFNASLFLYFFSLIVLCVGILVGQLIFDKLKDPLSVLLGIMLMSIYFLILKRKFNILNKNYYPQITKKLE
ncbi:MAG: SoxR reducing system RseC family protein [Melioribacteraceae bacterium]|nr:SoxR reducing system RseC family protein [Melioribacteraceae bacterium]